MKIIGEESAVLTLDFWEDEIIYEGRVYPAGSLAADVLNIPEDVITQMTALCNNLNRFMQSLNSGKGNAAQLPLAKQGALKLLKLAVQYKPFSYVQLDKFLKMVEQAFSLEALKAANALIAASRTGALTDQLNEKYSSGLLLLRLLPVLAHLGYSLGEFQKTMLPFAEKLHEAEQRLDVTYAEIFNRYYPKELTFEDAGGWMSMTNTTMQYVVVQHPRKGVPVLVKRMHYVSFVGMFRSDFFEGLRYGNAPRRCRSCGRWFLTTDGYKVLYCDNLAPNDPKGRTCRAVGAKNGSGKEKAENHPIKRIYETRRNTISKCVHRGKLEKELAEMVMKLAEEKRTRAFRDNEYFQNSYRSEMMQEAIVAEAQRILLGRSGKG